MTEDTPKERVTQPYKENDAAMEERRLAKSQVAEREANWAGEGGLMEKILDAEDARKQKMLYRQREYQESLAQQTAELEKWKAEMGKDRVPAIGEAFFFSRFGK